MNPRPFNSDSNRYPANDNADATVSRGVNATAAVPLQPAPPTYFFSACSSFAGFSSARRAHDRCQGWLCTPGTACLPSAIRRMDEPGEPEVRANRFSLMALTAP